MKAAGVSPSAVLTRHTARRSSAPGGSPSPRQCHAYEALSGQLKSKVGILPHGHALFSAVARSALFFDPKG
eukprot:879203-Prymnesium_polylepis.1